MCSFEKVTFYIDFVSNIHLKKVVELISKISK